MATNDTNQPSKSKDIKRELVLWNSTLEDFGVKIEQYIFDQQNRKVIPTPSHKSLLDFCQQYCGISQPDTSCQQEFIKFLEDNIESTVLGISQETKCNKGLLRKMSVNFGNSKLLVVTALHKFKHRNITPELEKRINKLSISINEKRSLEELCKNPPVIEGKIADACIKKLDSVTKLFSEHPSTEIEWSMINEIVREINDNPFNLIDTLSRIKDACISLSDAHKGCIILRDTDNGKLSRYLPCDKIDTYCEDKIANPNSCFNEVIRSKTPRLIADTESSEYNFYKFNTETKSELDIPLLYNGDILGLIHVSSTNKNHFTLHHQQILTILSGYVATAINTIHGIEKKVTQANKMGKELYSLMTINKIIQEESDVNKLSYTFLTGVTHKMGCAFPRAFIFLYDPYREELRGKMGIGALNKSEAELIWSNLGDTPLEVCIANYTAIKDQFMNIPVNSALAKITIPIDKNGANLFTKAIDGIPQRYEELGSDEIAQYVKELNSDGPVAIVPLKGRGGVLGVVMADRCFFETKSPITEEELSTLSLFADQTALALENLYLTKRDTLITELTLGLTEEILNWKNLLEKIIYMVKEKMQVAWVTILLMNETTKKLEVMTSTGSLLKNALKKNKIMEYELGEGISGWVAKNGDSLRLDRCGDSKELIRYGVDLSWRGKFIEEPVDHPEDTPFLGIPIKKGNKIKGVIRLARGHYSQAFTYQEQKTMESVAIALAVVIENAERIKNLREDHYKAVHDLNNFIGGAEVILDKLTSDKVPADKIQSWQKMAASNVKSLRMIIDNLNQAGRMELGLLTVQKKNIELEEIIKDCTSLSIYEPLLKKLDKTGVKIIVNNPQEIKTLITSYDGFQSIVSNLISNAVKFANNNTNIEVNISREVNDYHVEVVNYGTIIPKEEQVKLFLRHPFWSNNPRGLGLIIVKEWADRLGGRIEVESNVDTGTRFKLTLSL
jgi:signal transduction histidine kinase/putative methionine-R-sulfoxide reductase with GAF domain